MPIAVGVPNESGLSDGRPQVLTNPLPPLSWPDMLPPVVAKEAGGGLSVIVDVIEKLQLPRPLKGAQEAVPFPATVTA